MEGYNENILEGIELSDGQIVTEKGRRISVSPIERERSKMMRSYRVGDPEFSIAGNIQTDNGPGGEQLSFSII